MLCPNTNDKNWQILETELGPIAAHAVFETMGVPNISEHAVYKEGGSVLDTLAAIKRETFDDLAYEVDEANRADEVIANKKLRLARTNSQISRAEKANEFGKVADLQKKKEDLQNDIEDLETNNELENIIEHGKADMLYLDKLLAKDEISDAEMDAARKITGTWIRSVDFMTAEEKDDLDIIRTELAGLATEAEMKRGKLEKIATDNLEGFIKSTMGQDFVTKLNKDIGFGQRWTLDISHIQDSGVLTMFKSIKKANSTARTEAGEIMSNLEKMSKKLKKKYGSMNRVYDMLAQTYENGQKTGGLITKISADYQQEKFNKRKAYLEFKGKDEARFQQAKQEYVKFLSENEVSMDPRKLFGTMAGKAEHEAELKEAMGETEFERRMELLEGKLEQYNDRFESLKDFVYAEHGEGDVAEGLIRKWELENSPFEWANYLDNAKSPEFKGLRPQGYRYTYSLPKNQNAYDSRFSAIENDADLKEYYDFMVETMRDLQKVLPEDQRDKMRTNAIPFIANNMVEVYNKEGFRSAAESIYGNWVKSMRTKPTGSVMYEYQDPATGEIEDYLRAPDLDDRTKVTELFRIKKAQFKDSNNGTAPNTQQEQELYQEARNEVAASKSYDLNRVLGSYALLVKAYEHKSAIEDQVKAIKHYVNTMEEDMIKNGVIQKDYKGRVMKKSKEDSFKNLRDVVGNHLDMVFYDKPKPDEGITNKEVLTPEEKKRKAELEELLASENITKAEKAAVQAELDKIGGKLTTSGILNNVMKWVQLKGMGYNPLGGVSNLMFGNISNITHAAGGEDFSFRDYMRGNAMALQTIGKGTTGSANGRKLSNLMKKLDVLKDSTNEIEKGAVGKFAEKYGAFAITKRTEFMNQAPVLYAMMAREGVWDQFDENGDYTGDGGFNVDELKIRLDQVIKNLHGNYDPDSPLLIKKYTAGRMMTQFRTWMFESVNNRFGKEEYDQIMKRTKKGRYRSYKLAHAMVLPLMQDFYKAWTDSENMTDVDKANLRKNSVELLMLIGTMSTLALLAMGAEDDDEKKAYYNLAINMLSRAQDDILFYVNPSSFQNITKQLIPASSMITDTTQLITAAGRLIIGDDEIETGTFAGDSRFMREFMQYFPVLAKVQGLYSAQQQIYR